MHKIIKIFFVWVIFGFLQRLSAAEDKDFSMVPVLPNEEIVLRFVVSHYLNDHNELFSFAETNKAYQNYMLSLADIRKKILSKVIIGEPLGSMIHKYGGVYCQAYRPKNLNELVLKRSILRNGESSEEIYHCGRFISSLPYKQAPFFKDTGELCFYGYGMMQVDYKTRVHQLRKKGVLTILRYDVCNDQVSRLRCLMAKKGDEVGGKQMYRRFDFCMEYPSLLKAILNSSLVTKQEHTISGSPTDSELVFWLDGVTIPNKYAEKIPIQEFSDNWAFNNYEHLPAIIKDFIAKT